MKKSIVYVVLLSFCHAYAQESVSLVSRESSTIDFARQKISKSLSQKGYRVTFHSSGEDLAKSERLRIILGTTADEKWINSIAKIPVSFSAKLEPEGFSIQSFKDNNSQTIFVIGKDDGGLLYGGLELAEVIKLYGPDSIGNIVRNPYMKKRGVKMNIPLDVRTPSYTDMSDAAQQNIGEMWSVEFWKEYLDSLASYRFNFVSLWSLHPFPSMVKVPEYPDVALDDVHRSKAIFKEYYPTRATGFDAPEIVNNYEVLKKITIEEKIKFWQEVMRYAKERNIDFYIVTWNIYTCGTNGKYGITDDINNPTTKDYFRKSIKQLFLTYPLLAGIGLTTGENMPGADFQTKEDWAFDTYGLGVLDVSKLQPDRKITLIHRQHEAGALDIVKKFNPLLENKNINFVFSFKYAQAHVYSSTTQIHHLEFAKQIQSRENLKTLWTLRNDDVYYFRWGSPDFVREFIKNIPMNITEGYYYGSDQYVWGREFLDHYPEGKREIELAKHWYHWMLWGRLGYDPDVLNKRFIDYLQVRYSQADGRQLFDAWQSASTIYPLTTGFHYGALDFQWYIEASKSRPEPAQTASGYHDINRFVTLPPYKATGFVSIPEYVKLRISNSKVTSTSPVEVAGKINQEADNALRLLQTISDVKDTELYKTTEDIIAMSYLGKYYAHKILAATNLQLSKSTTDTSYHRLTVKDLNASSLYWRYYASTALSQYKNPLWTNRVGYVDWKDIYRYTLLDILNHDGIIDVPDMEPTEGGIILEAESATNEHVDVTSGLKGFTGSAYVVAMTPGGRVQWEFDAPRDGIYVLEFRYNLKSDPRKAGSNIFQVPVLVNGNKSAMLNLWPSGSDHNWVWDRVQVKLEKGNQQISISLPEEVLLDHVNVLSR